MTMKRTELEKRKGLKIANALRQSGNRFDAAANVPRREQRERDRAAGLVPVAVKLRGDLVEQLHKAAQQRQLSLSDLMDRLLRSALKETSQ